ncbi:MAG: TRAP transporter large permease [Eubacteriaceae bacterium]
MNAFPLTVLLFFLFMILGIPIAAGLILSLVITNIFFGIYPFVTMATLIYRALDSYVLIAVPLFLLAGISMSIGGVSNRIFNFSESLVGPIRGSMGNVNVLASMFFGGMSGSSVADVAGLGKIEIKEMTERGYPIEYSTAVTVASATMSVIIPPSILLVIYAVTNGLSVGNMLLAGLFPGILIGIVLLIFNIYMSSKNNWGAPTKFSISNVWERGKYGFLAILTPLIILVGIFSGSFTPTEASAVAFVYALFLGIFVFKGLKLNQIPEILYEGARTTGIVALSLCGGLLFANFLALENVPQQITDLFLSVTSNPILIMLGINFILLVAGMFLNTGFCIIVFSPIFLPLVTQMGYSPIHFGIIMVCNLAIGLTTPPVGACLYAGSAVSGLKLEVIAKWLLPFWVCLLFTLFLIVIFPWLSLCLPSIRL